MTYFGRPLTSGSAVTWNGNSFVFDSTISSSGTAGVTRKYPDPSQAVLAWDFTGTSGTIANIGSAAGSFPSASLDRTLNNGVSPLRNVPGPVSPGTGFGLGSPASQSTGLISSAGAGVNLGTSQFSTAGTFVVFFDSRISAFVSGIGSDNMLGIKSFQSGTWNSPFSAVGLQMNSTNFLGYFGTGSTNFAQIALNSPTMSSLFRPGMHMAAVTFQGGVATRLYFDGVQVAAQTTGVSPNVGLLGAESPTVEGPWSFGALPQLTPSGFANVWPCVIYAARVYNVAQSAAWIRQAWLDAQGWPSQ